MFQTHCLSRTTKGVHAKGAKSYNHKACTVLRSPGLDSSQELGAGSEKSEITLRSFAMSSATKAYLADKQGGWWTRHAAAGTGA